MHELRKVQRLTRFGENRFGTLIHADPDSFPSVCRSARLRAIRALHRIRLILVSENKITCLQTARASALAHLNPIASEDQRSTTSVSEFDFRVVRVVRWQSPVSRFASHSRL
jgi:hypothetical protein